MRYSTPKYYMIRLIVLSWKRAPHLQKWLRLELEKRSTLERKPLTELHRFLSQEMEGEAVQLLKIDKPTSEWTASEWAEGPVHVVNGEVWWGRVPKNEWVFPAWVFGGRGAGG
ncbi:hypothetical protein Slin15195_G044550 [Septoria linicola]|uniref:Uncharacterized protein n=1 Tax=Septoria linicola TaxID=215465 RepID=A0A9Q9EGT9_9PEZI|nr:hypothetical protein Slin14017_G048070 [Septoria linicola]USW51136.1 hypothetical protein Slin15195_G044550 [Septoria linicola]